MGADVPYFLEGGTALGLNRGDRVLPIPGPRRSHLVIVVPPFGVSTKDAYAWWDRDHAARLKPRAPAVNDLQAPVAKRHPEISRIVDELRRAGAMHAAMSGSGSAVFGLFATPTAAARAATAVRRRGRRRWRIEKTRTLSRAECRALAAK